ncbi:hypothetical protein B0H13DRAFT_2058218 [Mycena leptocephala]|nr:hypothetical protein B0H13DRAFT_2058218 [Mycena leptocephala]
MRCAFLFFVGCGFGKVVFGGMRIGGRGRDRLLPPLNNLHPHPHPLLSLQVDCPSTGSMGNEGLEEPIVTEIKPSKYAKAGHASVSPRSRPSPSAWASLSASAGFKSMSAGGAPCFVVETLGDAWEEEKGADTEAGVDDEKGADVESG